MSINDKVFEWTRKQDNDKLRGFGLWATGTLDHLVGTSQEMVSHMEGIVDIFGTDLALKELAPYVAGILTGSVGMFSTFYLITPAVWLIDYGTRVGKKGLGMLHYEKGDPERRRAQTRIGPIGLTREFYAASKVHPDGAGGVLKEQWQTFTGLVSDACDYISERLPKCDDGGTAVRPFQ